MVLAQPTLPFGLRDIKVRTLTGETAGTSVDLPNARTLSFSESEDSEELRGDDAVVATHGLGPTVEWELEAGGYGMDAVKTMFGGTTTASGTTPNQKITFARNTSDQRPYFQIEGQAISDSGGDFHILLYRCKATGDFSGELADGAFWLTGASGVALGRTSDGKIWDHIQNETIAAIT